MEPGHTRGCTEHFHVACVDVNTTDATTGATALLLLRLYRAGGLRAIGYEACRVQMYRVPVLTTVPLGACLPVPVQSFTVLYIMSFERPS